MFGKLNLPLVAILFMLFSVSIYSQQYIFGKYYNNFGDYLELGSDYTFEYNRRVDALTSWSTGKWTISNDTLYLKTILVFDTLNISDPQRTYVIDSLVPSFDLNPERFEIEEYEDLPISRRTQNKVPAPEKLYYFEEELYFLNDKGKPDKRKIKQTGTGLKFKTSLKRID